MLDKEVDVPRFYADLVPSQLQPDVFWARYFFRLELLIRSHSGRSVMDGEDDDDEELTWDEATPAAADDAVATGESSKSNMIAETNLNSSTKVPTASLSLTSLREEVNVDLQKECIKLRATVKSLANRVAELEAANAKLIADNNALRKLGLSSDLVSSSDNNNKNTAFMSTSMVNSHISSSTTESPASTVISSSKLSNANISIPLIAAMKTSLVSSDDTVSLECDSESDSISGAVLISSRHKTNLARSCSPSPGPTPSSSTSSTFAAISNNEINSQDHTNTATQNSLPSSIDNMSIQQPSPSANTDTISNSGNGSVKPSVSGKIKSGSTEGGRSLLEEDEEDETWD